jgi:ectoine hydroxylase-related dioxygenase (phytanoyl-CoA dioxygenase family)
MSRVIDEIADRGFSILEGVLSSDECRAWSEKVDRLNRLQIDKFGERRLAELNEIGTIRGMMRDDPELLSLVRHPATWPIVEAVVGSTAILHLQNGIVVEPREEHHQTFFHRDFAKDFVADKVLSLNAFFILDDFTPETGATWLVPGTHRSSTFPELRWLEENALQVEAPAGSVMMFDSLLIHRAGSNRSTAPRRAINHQYTRPFIKQQMDYPVLMRGLVDAESPLAQTLGFWSVPPKSAEEFRVDPDRRTYRRYQG